MSFIFVNFHLKYLCSFFVVCITEKKKIKEILRAAQNGSRHEEKKGEGY